MSSTRILNSHSGLTQAQTEHLRHQWGAEAENNIRDGIMEPWTQDLIVAIVGAMQSLRVLELGTSTGQTTAKLLTALAGVARLREKPALLVSVDNNVQRHQRARNALASLHETPAVELGLLLSDSKDFLRSWQGEPFDLAILDDNHDVEHVREEIVLASKVVRKGGLLLVHDVYSIKNLHELVTIAGGINIETVPVHIMGAGLGIIEVRK